MQNLSLARVAEILEAVARASDPTFEMTLAERRLAVIAEIARLIETDVWIFATGEMNSAVPGDAMYTSFVDRGFHDEQERADFLRVVIHPELAPIVTAPMFDALAKRESITRCRSQLIDQRAWNRSSFPKLWNEIGFNDFIISVYPVGEWGHSCVGFHRRVGQRRFTVRDCALVHLLFQHIPWLHQSARPDPITAEVISLSPRERQVMLCLMHGDSRKQVAHKLKLSEHTVTDYLKEIYRKFDVNSRAELLAKFIAQEGKI